MTDELSSIFKGSAIIFLGTIIQLVLGLVGKLLFARYLGPLHFGGLSVGIAIATTGSALLVLGMNQSVTRYIPRFEQKRKQKAVVSSALHIVLPVSLFSSIVLIVAAPFLAESIFDNTELIPVIQLFSLLIPVMVLYKLCNSIFQGLKRVAPKVLLENITRPILYFLLIGVVIIYSGGVVEASFAYIIPWVVVTTAAIIFSKRYLGMLSLSGNESMHRNLILFSLPLMLSVGMQQIFNRIDIFFIGSFASVAQVGIYSAIYPIARTQLAALAAINYIFTPVVSALDSNANRGEIESYYRIITKWLYLSAFPVVAVFIFHPSWVINIIFGSEYVGGSSAFSILALGFFLSLVMGPASDTIVSLGNTKVIMIMTTMTAILNVLLNFVLIPDLGISGAAIATAISYFILNATYLGFLYYRYNLFPFTYKLLLTWAAIPCIILLIRIPVSEVVTRELFSVIVVFCVAATSSLIAFIFFLDISNEERKLLNAGRERLGL